MKNLLLSAIVAASVGLGGCSTTGTPPITNINSFIAQVQSTAVAVCAFLPTAGTVAEIITLGNPLVSTVDQIVSSICTAVATTVVPPLAGTRFGIAPPTVLGVVVHGRFVK
jgi:hypothetical protein